jgi:hypothetical protein
MDTSSYPIALVFSVNSAKVIKAMFAPKYIVDTDLFID